MLCTRIRAGSLGGAWEACMHPQPCNRAAGTCRPQHAQQVAARTSTERMSMGWGLALGFRAASQLSIAAVVGATAGQGVGSWGSCHRAGHRGQGPGAGRTGLAGAAQQRAGVKLGAQAGTLAGQSEPSTSRVPTPSPAGWDAHSHRVPANSLDSSWFTRSGTSCCSEVGRAGRQGGLSNGKGRKGADAPNDPQLPPRRPNLQHPPCLPRLPIQQAAPAALTAPRALPSSAPGPASNPLTSSQVTRVVRLASNRGARAVSRRSPVMGPARGRGAAAGCCSSGRS